MNHRTDLYKTQDPTKSKVNLAKPIPFETIFKPSQPQNEDLIILPPEKPNVPRSKQQISCVPKVKNVKRKNQAIEESEKVTAELIEKLFESENQLKEARTIQINLEDELSQRLDEKIKLIYDYEAKIRSIETELASLKEKDHRDDQIQQLKEENSRLFYENIELQRIKIDLEFQMSVDRINKQFSPSENGQIENKERDQQVILERLKEKGGNSDTEGALLAEISRLEELLAVSEGNRIYVERQREIDQLNRNVPDAEPSQEKQEKETLENLVQEWRQKHADSEFKGALFAIEIERLGNIVWELQRENEHLRDQILEVEEYSEAQITEFKRQYEFIIRPQIEAEIKRSEDEKNSRELEIQTYKTNITELENRVSLLRTDLGILQKKREELLTEVEDWKSQIENAEANKKSREQAEKNLVKEKEKVSELETELFLVSSENELLNSGIFSQKKENDFLRKRMSDVTQEHKKQQEKLKKQLEDAFNQILGGFVIE